MRKTIRVGQEYFYMDKKIEILYVSVSFVIFRFVETKIENHVSVEFAKEHFRDPPRIETFFVVSHFAGRKRRSVQHKIYKMYDFAKAEADRLKSNNRLFSLQQFSVTNGKLLSEKEIS